MSMSRAMSLWGTAVAFMCLTAPAVAQNERSDAASRQQQPEAIPRATKPPIDVAKTDEAPPAADPTVDGEIVPPKDLPGPKLLNLRYDEDFSYLDGEPGTYREDFFDPLKNIHLGDDWRLDVGGEFRFQLQSHTNFAFGARQRTQDTFQLYRYFAHVNLRYRDTFRLFLQGAAVHEENRTFGPRPIDENYFALQQLFIDVKPLGDDTPLTLRVGRQELSYGAQRFVSPLEWANTRRRFDAVKLIWKAENWQFDFFYSKPIPVNRTGFDDNNEEFDFWGAYWTYQGIPRHGIDVFAFAIDDTGNRVNPNGRRGDVTRFTVGGRFYGKTGGFDYDAMLSAQWGTWAGDTIEAWAWSLDGGYTFQELACKPRIGVGFDWASGDQSATDGTVETFDQMFPLGHAYLGFMDFFSRQNVSAVNVNLSAWPVPKKIKVRVAYHAFWLESKDDALYGVTGAPGRRDPNGDSGREVGHEVDVTMLWKIDAHQTLLLGYSHFFPSTFIENTGPSEDADMVYLQYKFKF